jgi:Tol biopolymer transport system component
VGVYADEGATDYNLLLFDGATGGSLGTIDTGSTAADPANHPDWSPDGSRIAFTRMGIKGTNQRMFKGSIEMVTFDGADWSDPTVIVPNQNGKNRYYPSFSPDGSLLIFNESTCDGGNETGAECDADMDETATLWIVPAASGDTPIVLQNGNAPGVADQSETRLTNSFPKWSPFVFRRDKEQEARVMWLTFSSRRNYGLRSPPGDGALIWMVAVEPDKALAGEDPSHAAFAMPYQDLNTSNHIAQWTERVAIVQ